MKDLMRLACGHGPRVHETPRLVWRQNQSRNGSHRLDIKSISKRLEIVRDKSSFTIDTVEHFREFYGNAELFWIVGEDQFANLNKWHRMHELEIDPWEMVAPIRITYLDAKSQLKEMHKQSDESD